MDGPPLLLVLGAWVAALPTHWRELGAIGSRAQRFARVVPVPVLDLARSTTSHLSPLHSLFMIGANGSVRGKKDSSLARWPPNPSRCWALT